MRSSGWARAAGTATVVGGLLMLLYALLAATISLANLLNVGALSAPSQQSLVPLYLALFSLLAPIGASGSLLVPLLLTGSAVLVLTLWLWRRRPWLAGGGLLLTVLGVLTQLAALNVLYDLGYTVKIESPNALGFLRLSFGSLGGVLAYALGLWLLGNATRRARPLAFGNSLPLLLAVFPLLTMAVVLYRALAFDPWASGAFVWLVVIPEVICLGAQGIVWIALGVALWRPARLDVSAVPGVHPADGELVISRIDD